MRLLVLALAYAGCTPDLPPVVAPVATPEPRCRLTDVEVSGPGGGVRPSLAAGSNGFLVVWEDPTDATSVVMTRPFGDDGQPLGPAQAIGPAGAIGAEPRVFPDGDGFRVVWSGVGKIASRTLDALGTPRGEVVTLASGTDVRALSVTSLQQGFAVAWWSWSRKPTQQWISRFDEAGKPEGEPALLSSAPIIEAAVSLSGRRVAWLDMVGDLDHVMLGTIVGDVGKHDDLGVGSTPSIAANGVAWGRPEQNAVWLRSDGEQPRSVAHGLSPRLSDHWVCYFRENGDPEQPADELRCHGVQAPKLKPMKTAKGAKTAKVMPHSDEEVLLATLPGGLLNMGLAERPKLFGVVFQTDQDDRMKVRFATARCRW